MRHHILKLAPYCQAIGFVLCVITIIWITRSFGFEGLLAYILAIVGCLLFFYGKTMQWLEGEFERLSKEVDEINVRIEAKRYAYIGKRWLKTMYKTDDIIRITRDVYEVRKGKTIWKVKIIRI